MSRLRALSLGVSAVAIANSAAVFAQNVPAQGGSSVGSQGATAPTTPAAAESATAGDIVVTGIRASVQQSLDQKRRAATVVDVITAEDIGKLPDNNVAESLSRVPGVQIQRRDGDGSGFSVRGISQNLLQINGRVFTGPNESGAPALESLNPEILSGLEVIKSPSADMTEGALGAIVNLRTKRPLDLRGTILSGRVEGTYGTFAKDLGIRASGLFSTHLANDTIGILLAGAYTSARTRGFELETSGYVRTSAIDVTGDGVADANLFRLNRVTQGVQDRSDERTTFNGALQWKPSSSFEFLLEGTYSKLNRQRIRNLQQLLLSNTATSASADANGTITRGTFSGVTVRPLTYDVPTVFETYNIGASGKYHGMDDRLTVSLEASYSKGKGNDSSPGSPFTYVVAQRAGRTASASYDLSGASRNVPDSTVTSNFDINDPTQYQLVSVFDAEGERRNKGYDGRFDVEYKFEHGIVSKISAGARYERLQLFSSNLQNLPGAAALLAGRDRNGDGILTVDELPGLVYNNQFSGGYYGDEPGNYRRSWLTGSVDKLAARRLFNLPDLTLFGPITQGATSVRAVDQDGYAAYVKADFAGDIGALAYRANAGVRYARTDRVASGYLSNTVPTATSARFENWLPSGNLAIDLTPKLIVRFAAAKVVARPDLSLVGPGFSPNTTNLTGTRGNPNLRPFQATQYDATIEWYFARASILSAALFRKDVNSFTVTTVTSEFIPGFSNAVVPGSNPATTFGNFNISQPQNGTNGRVQGFEVNYQQAFTFLPSYLANLGVQANYTYADSETPIVDPLTGRTLPLPLLSKHSYSVVGYYEDKTFNVRLAYTHRSPFLLVVQPAANAGSKYNDEYGQLDASASFNLSDRFRFTFEAQNLTQQATRQYDGVRSRLDYSIVEDTRYFAGIAANF